MNQNPIFENRIYSIVPPYILEAIARNGTAEQRASALQTLMVDQQIRSRREALVETPPAETPGVWPLAKNRLVYTANNTEQQPGTLVRSEGQPPSNDVAVNEAYDGFGATFDLYCYVYGRNSIDDRGMNLSGVVHFGSGYHNAFWDYEAKQMVFGDGDGLVFGRFTASVDAIGHELTHGVIDYTAKLEYHDQSGTISEHIADVFGSLAKQRLLGQTADQADWLIGAGIYLPSIHAAGLRSMKAPGTAFDDPVIGKDPQPDHMSRYINTTEDWGGVHKNSGILNKAFYLAATAIGGYAWEKAGQIWYRTLLDPNLTPKATFQDFANLTARKAGNLFGKSVRAAVVQAWHDVGIEVQGLSGWLNNDLTAATGAPTAAGSPAGYVFKAQYTQHVLSRSADGHVQELWWDGGGWHHNDLTTATGTPTAAGSPIGYGLDSGCTQHVISRGSDGHIRELWWDAKGWHHHDLTSETGSPTADGDPDGYVFKAQGTQHVFFRSADGHIRELWWDGDGWHRHDLTSAVNAPTAIGDPAGYMFDAEGTQHVIYRCADGHIHEMWWDSNGWHDEDVTAGTGGPTTVGDPAAYMFDAQGTQHIIYRGADGHIREFWWDGGWHPSDLTAQAGAPAAAGDPAGYVFNAQYTQHVVYRSGDGHIHELWWENNGWHHNDLTWSTGAPLAAGDPTGYMFDDQGTQHVVYRSVDNHIQELWWS